MDLTEKTASSELIYDGKVVHLYRDTVLLPDGKYSVREYVKHVGAVCVIALTDQNEILLERQYRDYLSGYFDWEERPHAGKWLVFSMLMRFFLGYYYM